MFRRSACLASSILSSTSSSISWNPRILVPPSLPFLPTPLLPSLRRFYSSYPPGSQPEEEKGIEKIYGGGAKKEKEKEKEKEREKGNGREKDPKKEAHQQIKKRKKTSILTLQEMHQSKQKISMMTAHDYPSAMMVEQAGIDVLLVGDSLAMVALGYDSTTSITMEEMLHHCRAVSRGASLPFLVGDMPFGSYQISPEAAISNATRFLKEGKMEAVKIEGGIEIAETARKIVRAGIPVLGHIGLTPQSQSALGGYRVQGKSADSALKLISDAKALESAGCFGIVVEAVPELVGKAIAEAVRVPTIGIGAGKYVSGQVLVQQDLLGIFDKFVPRFCKQYAHLGPVIKEALQQYHEEVKGGAFPKEDHVYPMDQEEQDKFLIQLDKMRHFD